jgi:Mn2+/Fe2+ NRAMP family transporter
MKPWSAKLPPLSRRALTGIGAGALIGSFYIGTGDIAIATKMGALFGMDMWWTFFVLGLAGWTLMDMSARYYLRFGRTPLSIFKEVHPVFSIYLFVTVVVTTIIGAYSQWNTCAHVLSTLNPGIPTEVGGALAGLAATALLVLGVYRRIELFFVFALILLIGLFALAALAADAPWSAAAAGLIPSIPESESDRAEWLGLIQKNAGSMINAWLILIYPYTMIEKGWRSSKPLGQARILQRARWDYGVGIAAAGMVALPVMAAAAAVARPFGIVPENATDLAALLEPLAGSSARMVFLVGFFIAAWTAGIGWMVCGAYAMLDLGNLKVRMESRSFRLAIVLFIAASASLLFLRINPVYGIRIFTVLLAVVFPVVALVMVWRISRPDMGYFRWSTASLRGVVVIALDVFALLVSLFVGWGIISGLLA